ncbi:polysaccharide pyruvyl transferase family protein [Peribacillus simplex]|uniref:polysaccharide pyruvyl transferase family protein n=2 Tax=Peribacillus simplex TaxID=1478 RepID=UPI003670E4D5
MKKIGILTINDYNNYGNRLQNYAAQEVLKSLGYHVETVINNTDFNKKNNKSTISNNKIQKIKKITPQKILKKVALLLRNNYFYNKRLETFRNQRIKVFKEFTSSYIIETDISITESNIPNEIVDRYDYFVTGSDQVWNPNYRKGSPIDFLTFAPKNKRIAFAPSFGVSEIPKEYHQNYKKWLTEMHGLSVREEAGAKIIKNLTGRNATVLIDPTLMLTKEKWLSISKLPLNKPKGKYLLTYFLGDISRERKKYIKEIAENNDLQIVNLLQIKEKFAYMAGPDELIDYISTASILCTDSFHGAVFSILLETPFIIYDRENQSSTHSMNSRIDTLLSTFRLESRLAKNIKNNKEIFEVDFSHVQAILDEERRKTYGYLKAVLNI